MEHQTLRETQRSGDLEQGGAPARPGRPRGLAVVVTVDVLLGLLSTVGGLGALAATAVVSAESLGFLQILAPVLALVLIAFGVFFLVISYGLWRGNGWAWTAAIVFAIAHVIADVGFAASRSFALDKFIGLAVLLGTLYYLTRPRVRAYFGNGPTAF